MSRGNGEMKGVLWRGSRRGMERGRLWIGVRRRENERQGETFEKDQRERVGE